MGLLAGAVCRPHIGFHILGLGFLGNTRTACSMDLIGVQSNVKRSVNIVTNELEASLI